jgi:UDP-glucuronate 4-epimerase
MKILVTGAAGFIGSYVCKYLLSRGDEVVGLDNINSYYDINLKYGRLLTLGIEENAVNWYLFVESNVYEKFRFIRMNLEDKQAMQMLFANERFDKVVNLAAQAGVRYSIENPYAYVESNIDGFLNVLEGCRHYRVKHLIYASSSSVYGLNGKVPFSENVLHILSVFTLLQRSLMNLWLTHIVICMLFLLRDYAFLLFMVLGGVQICLLFFLLVRY